MATVAARRWKRVISLGDCKHDKDTDEYLCPKCKIDYAECPCPGPGQADEYEYMTKKGVLYARRKDAEPAD